MPGLPSPNDTSSRTQQSQRGSRRQGKAEAGGQRATVLSALPLVSTGSDSVLSPLLSGLKGIFPSAASREDPRTHRNSGPGDVRGALVQRVDLGDGSGQRAVLVQWRETSIQILSLPFTAELGSVHKPVSSVAPTELFSLPQVLDCPSDGRSSLLSTSSSAAFNRHIISAQVVHRAGIPLLAILTSPSKARNPSSSLSLILVRLSDGQTINYLELGRGRSATLLASKRALVVALASPLPVIHILDLESLRLSHSSITDVAVDPRCGLPIVALTGRTLAFATSIPSIMPGPDGLGSIVTASSRSPLAQPEHPKTSDRILSSAAEIGSGVARGVWAGLKIGVRAASSAQGRLAKSAPVDGQTQIWRSHSGDAPLVIPTSPVPAAELREEEVDLKERVTPDTLAAEIPAATKGRWVVVLDLFPRRSSTVTGTLGHQDEGLISPATVAHFALSRTIPGLSSLGYSPSPRSQATVGSPRDASCGSPYGRSPSNRDAPPSNAPASSPSIQHLSFSPNGLFLSVGPSSGRVLHVFELRPSPVHNGAEMTEGSAWSRGLADVASGEVWERYQLKRGLTSAAITSVHWGIGGGEGGWVGVGTSTGTVHVFPICQSGGQPTHASHVSLSRRNAQELQPLSVAVQPLARLRSGAGADAESTDDLESLQVADRQDTGKAVAFAFLSASSIGAGATQQDILVCRCTQGQIDLVRMEVRLRQPAQTPGPGSPRGSGLTEMMKDRGLMARDKPLIAEHRVLGRWSTELEGEASPLYLKTRTCQDIKREPTPPTLPIQYLAQAEIQTHSTSRRILPTSVYLNKQIEFFAAAPVDIYTPLSVLDPSSRLRRLVFRPDIEVRSSASEPGSFDEPLSTALHSTLDARPSTLIPGLPNGQPSRTTWRQAIPIRQVAAGLGEGVGRVRREIARAQHTRQRRRESGVTGTSLSFDEAAVFPSSIEGRLEDASLDDGSSPDSMFMRPATESSVGADDRSDEWEEGWEEEYQRAVAEDGPDDLILGLLDEEEEERSKWEQRRQPLKEPQVTAMNEKSSQVSRRKDLPASRITPSASVAALSTSHPSGKETHVGS